MAEISFREMLQTVALLVAAAGLFLNAIQARRATAQRRVEQVFSLFREFLNDDKMMEAYYAVEYGQFTYGPDFHGSDLEQGIDRVLDVFESIARLYKLKMIRRVELDLVSYHYLVLYQNPEISKYFAFLDDWHARRGIRQVPFGAFREVGEVVEKREYLPRRQVGVRKKRPVSEKTATKAQS